MTPRGLSSVGVRMVGVMLLATGILSLPTLAVSSVEGHLDGPMAVYTGFTLAWLVLGVLFLRQSRWVAGLFVRGGDLGAAHTQLELTLRGLRTFALSIVGWLAALSALGRTIGLVRGDPVNLTGAEREPLYTIVVYAVIALGCLLGPATIVHLLRGMWPRPAAWRAPTLDGTDIENVGFGAAAAWFGVNALALGATFIASHDQFESLDSMRWAQLGVLAASGVLCGLCLIMSVRRSGIRSPWTQTGFEIAAGAVLLDLAPSAGIYLAWLGERRPADILSLGRLSVSTTLALWCAVAAAAGLLIWAARLRRTAPLGPAEVFN